MVCILIFDVSYQYSVSRHSRIRPSPMSHRLNTNVESQLTSNPTTALTPVHALGTSSQVELISVSAPTKSKRSATPILANSSSTPTADETFDASDSNIEDIGLFFDWILSEFKSVQPPSTKSVGTAPPATASGSLLSHYPSHASSSTVGGSTTPPSESLLKQVLNKRKNLFTDTKSPTNKSTRNAGTSSSSRPHTRPGTREEAYFDMHLHPDLILKTVLPYPGDYYSVLERVVDDAMSQAGYRPPPIPENHRLHSVMRKNGISNQIFHISSTQPNEKIIQQTCGYVDRLCTVVSSTLFTAHGSWIEDPFITHSVDPTHGLVKAIGDGYTYVEPDAAPNQQLKDQLDLIIERDLSPIMVCEYKLWDCLDQSVWDALKYISSLDQDFGWTACEGPHKCKTTTCIRNGRFTVTGRKTGFDRSGSDAQPPISYSPIQVDTPASGPLTKAHRILQQIWAELVAIDGTYVILSNGNEELIGLRHRSTQSLLLSHVVKVARPSHLKHRCGLMMKALDDAMQRAQLNTDAPILPETYKDLYDDEGRSGRRNLRKGEVPDDEQWLYPKLRLKFDTSKSVRLDWVQTSDHPYLSAFPDSSNVFRSTKVVDQASAPFALYIDEPLAGAERSFHCRRFEGNECRGDAFVAKLASNAADVASLEWEYNVCLSLQASTVGGLPMPLGFYKHDQLQYAVMFTEIRGEPYRNTMDAQTRGKLQHWLDQVHDLGFTHGALRADRILIDNDNEASTCFCVVGWKNATYFDEATRQSNDAEEARLQDQIALDSFFAAFAVGKRKAKKRPKTKA